MSRKTPAQVAAAAEDAYDHRDDPADGGLVELAPTKNLSAVVSVRLSADDVQLLESAAASEGLKLSAFLRRAALSEAMHNGVINAQALGAQLDAMAGPMAALRAAVNGAMTSNVSQSAERSAP